MRALSVVFLLVAAIGFTLSGCADKPNPVEGVAVDNVGGGALEKATVINTNTVVQLDEILPADPAGCIEGSLHITGPLHVVTQMVLDENGDWKLKRYHNNKVGVTAETETGVIYKVIEVVNWPRKIGEGAWTATFVDNCKLIGPPGEPRAHIKIINHVVWTPNGDVSVEFYSARIECK